MTRWNYVFSGVRIASELRLPEWAAFEERHSVDEPDVVIVAGENQAGRRAALKFQVVGPDEYHFFVPDAAEYRVRKGREILVTPAPGAGDREVRLFLLGSALGALFYQRGLLCLHASVVRTPAAAVALCGPAGAGKSTLAAWLCERGFRFVSDDLCRIECPSGARAFVYPSTPRLKLWRDALAEMRRDESTLEHDHRRADKFHVAEDHDDPRSPVPLQAIYLLDWAEVGVVKLRGLAGLRELVTSASYRLDLVDRIDQTAAHWQRCADLASRVPIYRFSRPRDVAAMAGALDRLQAHASAHVGDPRLGSVGRER